MRDRYIRTGQGFIFMYSITDLQSFESVHPFREQMHRVKDADHVPSLLVGNKKDLEEMRCVATGQGEQLAREWSIPFFETSAKTRENIDEIFLEAVRQIRSQRKGAILDRPRRKMNCFVL